MKYVGDLLKENGYDLIGARYYFQRSNFTVMDDRGYLFEEHLTPLLRAASKNKKLPLGCVKKLGIFNLKRFLENNNIPFLVTDNNEYDGFSSGDDKMEFMCLKCNSIIYSSWNDIKNRAKGKRPIWCDDRTGDGNRWNVCHLSNPGGRHKPRFGEDLLDNPGLLDGNGNIVDSRISMEVKKYFVRGYFAHAEYCECISPITKAYLPYDIAFSHCDTYVEINGLQHYEYVPKFHLEKEGFYKQLERDKIKKEHAERNGIFIPVDLRDFNSSEEVINYIERIVK